MLTHHIDDKNVSNTANKNDDTEHDWDEELGDDVNVILLLLRQRHVHTQIWINQSINQSIIYL